MTNLRALRPDAQLVRLHAERGDPQARLAAALAALEDADWGLLFSGEAGLARQLAALLGPGTLRVDGRLDVSRAALAEAGLAVADLHGDLGGARAVWVMEPDQMVFDRARRAGVKVIVDATLAPGGHWPGQGADYVVYRDALTLSGHADAPLAALFGSGETPLPAAPPPSDLAVALVLRDVATLPLRLARAARTAGLLTERLGSAVRQAGPTALLLAPDMAADTAARPGGVLAAARHVPEGLLLTPGLEETDSVLALLRGEQGGTVQPAASVWNQSVAFDGDAAYRSRPGNGRREERRDSRGPVRERPRDERRDGPQDRRYDSRREQGRPPQPQPDRPALRGEFDRPEPAVPERVTFEAPVQPESETWEPEIVFSNLEHPPVPLTHTISSGPDAAPLDLTPPLAQGTGAPQPLPAEPLPDPSEELGTVAALAGVEVVGDERAEETPLDGSPDRVPGDVPPAPAELAEPLLPDLPQAPPASETGQDAIAADLTEEQAAIYARLREWRNAEAKRQEISRFIVASNAALAEIARRVPYTLDDLAAVRGMGPARLQKYGEKILDVVRG